jgi:Leucine-rich repeat (LRR) protein
MSHGLENVASLMLMFNMVFEHTLNCLHNFTLSLSCLLGLSRLLGLSCLLATALAAMWPLVLLDTEHNTVYTVFYLPLTAVLQEQRQTLIFFFLICKGNY